MTTTVTVKTHSWPVQVVMTDHFQNGSYEHHGVTKEVVPPDSAKDFHITNSRRIEFIELPMPTTSEHDDEAET